MFGVEPAFPRSDHLDEDVEGIVRWCAEQPDGLRQLAVAVRALEGSSTEADRIETLAEIGLPTRVLEPRERELVEQLLSLLDDRERAGLLHGLTNRWSERNRPDARDPRALVSGLEDSIPGADDLHPLYVVLSRLVHAVWDRLATDDLRYNGVGDLVSQVGQRTGVPPERLTDPPSPASTSDRQYFVVRLAESGRDPSRMLLDIWLVDDGDWSRRYASDETHTLDQIGPKIDEELARLAADEIDVGELRVEFILPRRLLSHPVDQWLMAAPGVTSPIGVHYPVVVRDLLRMRNRIIRKNWQLRCRSLATHGVQAVADAVRYEPLNPADPDLYPELMRNRNLPACMVVLGPSADYVPRRIQSWLTAGLPVIAWCRHNDAYSQFDRHLPNVITGRGINGLPLAVWQLRQDAGVNEPVAGIEHVGRHIVLLWDDADRIPPDDRLPLRKP
jgi:hypothetical protein